MIPVTIEVTSTTGLTRKAYSKAATAAWRATGAHWHRETLPKHFLRRAIANYRYKLRGAAYETSKQRKWGHRRPMVWSGKLRGQVTSSRSLLSRRAAVDITVTGGKALNLSGHNKRARMPDMAAEIQAVSPADSRELATVLDKELTRRLSADAPRRRV